MKMLNLLVVFVCLVSSTLIGQVSPFQKSLFDAAKKNEVLDIYLYATLYKEGKEFNEIDSVYKLLDEGLKNIDLKAINIIAYGNAIDKLGYHSQALDILSAVNSKLEKYSIIVQAEYFSAMGSVALNSMNPEFATNQYKKSLALIVDSNNVSKEIIQDKIIKIGVALNSLLKHEEAMDVFEKAMTYELLGTNRNSLYLKLNMALTNSCLGKLEEGKRYLLDALQVIKKNKDAFAELRTYGNLGDIYMEQDSFELARKLYNQGLAKAEESGYKLDGFRFQRSLSDLYYKNKQLDSAYIHLKLADSISNYYNTNVVSEKIVKMGLFHKIQREALEKEMNAELLKIEEEKKQALLFFCALLFIACLLLFRQLFLLREKNNFLLKEQLKSIQLEKNSSNSKLRTSNPSSDYTTIIDALSLEIGQNKIYTDKGLTLEKLAKKIQSNRTYLSDAINSYYQKSFSQWLNELRVYESKKMLASSDFDHYSIEGIAKDVGFASISTFNANFKKITGITPSYFRKNRSTPL
jgi:AraC-like DNA-binding protein